MKLPVNYDKITPRERRKVRLEYLKLQNSKCHHCGNDVWGPPVKEIVTAYIDESLFPKGFFEYPVHLHHDHNTGMTIGVVHNRCNAYLWQYHGE